MAADKAIVLTGGAGFIGSQIYAGLKQLGKKVVIIDWLGSDGQWKYFLDYPPSEVVDPVEAMPWLDAHSNEIEAIIHMGAISSTTASDADEVWDINVRLSQDMWRLCTDKKIPLIYASSAATYGAARTPEAFAEAGPFGTEKLEDLRPLNLYGWSKQAFDLWVAKQAARGAEYCPPQWVGLKFFNVYGPHEDHKGVMGSVIRHFYGQFTRTGKMKLFKSVNPRVKDGEQKRDFVWIGDVVDVVIWMLQHPKVNGLFNVGSGVARSFLDVAQCIKNTSKQAGAKKKAVEFIDMPVSLRKQYQDWTQADLTRLKEVGYQKPMTTLEDGVQKYVRYLQSKEQ